MLRKKRWCENVEGSRIPVEASAKSDDGWGKKKPQQNSQIQFGKIKSIKVIKIKSFDRENKNHNEIQFISNQLISNQLISSPPSYRG
jgi:uncharacterized protein with FMN-binding domain